METDKNHAQAIAQAIARAGIKEDEAVVAVTRDGRVYVGKADVQKGGIRNRYLARLFWWVGWLDYFFFVRVLRLPYLFDWIRTVRATGLRKH